MAVQFMFQQNSNWHKLLGLACFFFTFYYHPVLKFDLDKTISSLDILQISMLCEWFQIGVVSYNIFPVRSEEIHHHKDLKQFLHGDSGFPVK